MEMRVMAGNDEYLVRVTSLAGATGSFIWEICRGDGLLVIKRSRTAFPSRFEALLDLTQSAATLALEVVQNLPLPFV